MGLELPSGHDLRNSLDEAKENVEALMDELLVCIYLNLSRTQKKVIPPRLKGKSDDELPDFEAACAEEVSWPYIYCQRLRSDMRITYLNSL